MVEEWAFPPYEEGVFRRFSARSMGWPEEYAPGVAQTPGVEAPMHANNETAAATLPHVLTVCVNWNGGGVLASALRGLVAEVPRRPQIRGYRGTGAGG